MRPLRTLRGKLVFVLAGTLLVGLVLMGFTSVILLHRSLTNRVDQRLVEMSRPWERGRRPPPLPPGEREADRNRLPTDFRVLFLDSAGRPTDILGQVDRSPSGPLLRKPLDGPAVRTVPDRAGGAAWRVRITELPNGDTIALAMSLAGVNATVNQLVTIELIVGGCVLLVLAVAATVTVRLSLRPLNRIEQTADAIAAGELQRRVPDQDPRTETGRLGSSLNTMLGRLVTALHQREQSEQRMRRFVADASHELRTPLTSIRGFAELFRRSDRGADEEVRAMMSRIEAEATRMGGLVEDLLLLARLDRESTVELTDVDLGTLVREVVQDGRARAPDREVSLDVPDAAVRVLGDSHRLRQVLTNLVNNALEHTTPAMPVTVALAHGSALGDAVAAAGADLPDGTPVTVFSVADSGPGIGPEHAASIFDRFYRVDSGRSRGGSGLGLAITAALAEAHGGRVELRTNDRGGSTFTFVLPLS